jgi:hypothetical protein
MKKIVYIASLFFTLAAAVNAQGVSAKVAEIRSTCTEVTRNIEAGLKDKVSGMHNAVWIVGGKGDGRQWPAVGTMETRDEIWFEGGDGSGEASEPAVIRKLVSHYRGAADLHSRTEYCFDRKGEPVFIFSNSDLESNDGKVIETRFYYDGPKLVRMMRASRTIDGNFASKDLESAREALETATKLQKRYSVLISQ